MDAIQANEQSSLAAIVETIVSASLRDFRSGCMGRRLHKQARQLLA
jgi:Xaa-Pro aminopeptidase